MAAWGMASFLTMAKGPEKPQPHGRMQNEKLEPHNEPFVSVTAGPNSLFVMAGAAYLLQSLTVQSDRHSRASSVFSWPDDYQKLVTLPILVPQMY